MFAAQELSDDAFLSGRLRLLQPRRGYRAATDPVLLAAAVPAHPGESVLDLGCGVATAALCLAARVPGLRLAGLELQPDYADLAQRNAARNGMEMQVEQGDVARMPPALRRQFDHVIANPPYYAADGTPSPVAARDTALRAETPVSVWVAAGLTRLRPGGWLTLILSTPLLPEALAALSPRAGSAAVLPLSARAGQAARRVILQGRKGGRGPFRLLAPFILHDGLSHDGDRDSHSALASAVLRGTGDLLQQMR